MKRGSADKPLHAIDLFCGAGGLTRGLLDAGIKVVCGIDNDPACQFPYEFNNGNAKFVQADLGDLAASEIAKHFPAGPSFRILVGCAPCQPFSTYSRQFRRHSTDDRWSLLQSFSRIVGELRPDVVSMENVTQLTQHASFNEFRRTLVDYGYSVSDPYVVFGPDYGLPQLRKRLVFFASLHGVVGLMPPTHRPDEYVTLEQAIGGLEPLDAGQASQADRLHACCSLTSKNLQRIKVAVPGGTWRDWPKRLRLACHRKPSGDTYPSVYGRMEWEKPSPTITTQFYGFGNGRFGHPEQDRAISLREGAILQSFPDTYQFAPPDKPVCFRDIGRMIGNAVPVTLGKVVGKSITDHLKGCGRVKI